jgi:hypothetical protein
MAFDFRRWLPNGRRKQRPAAAPEPATAPEPAAPEPPSATALDRVAERAPGLVSLAKSAAVSLA